MLDMSASRFDPENLAFSLAIRLYRATEEEDAEKLRAIPRRGKELPQLVAQIGLVSSLAFYMSKIERADIYTQLYRYLVEDKEPSRDLRQVIVEDCKKEGGGYTVLLALMGAFISKTALDNIVNIDVCKNVEKIFDLARCLKDIRESGNEIILEKYSIRFLTVLKRLLEALFGREKQER